MALKTSLLFQQKQRLAVTQQMQQSVAILAMSNSELTEFLRKERDENPVLELTEPSPPAESGQGSVAPSTVIEETLADQETMISGLIRQMNACALPANQHKALQALIANLNEKGLLDEALQDIAIDHRLTVPNLRAALKTLQTFEPIGVGAISLSQCIELQLRSIGVWTDQFERLLKEINFRNAGIPELSRALHLPEEEVSGMLGVIRGVSLNPAETMTPFQSIHVIPDVIFYTAETGITTATLNENAFPRLRPDSAYLDGSLNSIKEVEIFLESQIARVSWLTHALEKRAASILRISVALAEAQSGFFTNGPLAVKPLVFRDIATVLKIHESTVSRTISGKFFSCNSGTFPLRHLFSVGLQNNKGTKISATAIRALIHQYIEGESSQNILSDTKLADLLKQSGIKVARRTIAKYRGVMNVPTSSIRRIQKRNK